MKVNFNIPLKGLDGEKIQKQDRNGVDLPEFHNVGKSVAEVLATETTGDPLKYAEWARKMYNGQEIDLDTSDQKTLTEYITKSPKMTALLKDQALALLDKKK